MNFILKVETIIKALKDNELDDIFELIQKEDDYVLFQATQNIQTSTLLISITIEDTPFNTIHYFITRIDSDKNKIKLLELINDFNEKNLLIKYYITNDDNLMARTTYICPQENFIADDFVNLIIPSYQRIKDDYPQIMKTISN